VIESADADTLTHTHTHSHAYVHKHKNNASQLLHAIAASSNMRCVAAVLCKDTYMAMDAFVPMYFVYVKYTHVCSVDVGFFTHACKYGFTCILLCMFTCTDIHVF
jgi:hypothetical protein